MWACFGATGLRSLSVCLLLPVMIFFLLPVCWSAPSGFLMSLQSTLSNPNLQSSLSNPNIQSSLSSHSFSNSLSSASLHSSLSNPSLQSSLSSSPSLPSSLSSQSLHSSLSNSSLQSGGYGGGGGVVGSGSSPYSVMRSGQGQASLSTSPRRRAQLSPLILPMAGESRRIHPKQFSPTMSPTLSSISQVTSSPGARWMTMDAHQVPPTGSAPLITQ